MTMSVSEAIDTLQAHAFASDLLFQSLFAALDPQQKQTVIDNVKHNFDAYEKGTNDDSAKRKLAAARAMATRVLGN